MPKKRPNARKARRGPQGLDVAKKTIHQVHLRRGQRFESPKIGRLQLCVDVVQAQREGSDARRMNRFHFSPDALVIVFAGINQWRLAPDSGVERETQLDVKLIGPCCKLPKCL